MLTYSPPHPYDSYPQYLTPAAHSETGNRAAGAPTFVVGYLHTLNRNGGGGLAPTRENDPVQSGFKIFFRIGILVAALSQAVQIAVGGTDTVGLFGLSVPLNSIMAFVSALILADLVHRFYLTSKKELGDDWSNRSREVGNHVYYLGFLFTLLALALSLLFLPITWQTGAQPTMAMVVGNNGIALLTTIVGLTLRVRIRLSSTDELADARKRLKREFSILADRTKEFHEMLHELSEKEDGPLVSFKNETKVAAGSLEDFHGKIDKASEKIGEEIGDIEGAIEEVKEAIKTGVEDTIRNEFLKLTREIGQTLSRAAGDYASSVKTMTARIEETAEDIDRDIFNRTITEALSPLKEETALLKSTIEKLRGELDQLDVPREVVPPEVLENFQTLASILKETGEATERLIELGSDFDRESSRSLGQALKDLEGILRQVSTAATESTQDFVKLQVAITDSEEGPHGEDRPAGGLAKSVKELASEAERAKKNLDGVIERLADLAQSRSDTITPQNTDAGGGTGGDDLGARIGKGQQEGPNRKNQGEQSTDNPAEGTTFDGETLAAQLLRRFADFLDSLFR